MNPEYAAVEPLRDAIDQLPGPTLLEFGSPGCGHCRAAQPTLAACMASHHNVGHIKVEDGRGRRLGRSFGIKLWPTLVFLRDGREMVRLVRPVDGTPIAQALKLIDSPP